MVNDIRDASVPCSFFKTVVKNHKEIKDTILNEINKIGIHSVYNCEERLYNTDFYIDVNTKRVFKQNLSNIILPIIQSHNTALSKKIDVKDIELDNYWYQQYKKNDFHKWHLHRFCVYSNVYYVNLDQSSSRTTFKHLGIEFSIEMEEGEILTFPSFYLHCSHPNQSDNIKTVIAFNTNPVT